MKNLFLPTLLIVSFMFTGCGAGRDFDFYSDLKQRGTCNNLIPHGTKHTRDFDEDMTIDDVEPFITEECFEDIISYFELDDSFTKLPKNTQMRLMESAVVVFNTSLALPPQGSVFKNAVPNAGTVSAALMCLFNPNVDKGCTNYRQEEGPIQKFVFNYMMNNIDILYYRTNNTNLAEYGPDDFLINGSVTFSPLFLGDNLIKVFNSRTPYMRASTLVHEARHREIIHDPTGVQDDEALGPYGFTMGYLLAVLYGNYDKRHPETGEYLLSDYDIQIISGRICTCIRDNINYINPKLKKWAKEVGCWGPDLKDGHFPFDLFYVVPEWGHDAQWWLQQHGLSRP